MARGQLALLKCPQGISIRRQLTLIRCPQGVKLGDSQHYLIFQGGKVRRQLILLIIQQIVTMPIYGKEALDICHPYMTDILRHT